jgi:large subunit ribosomal protein L25
MITLTAENRIQTGKAYRKFAKSQKLSDSMEKMPAIVYGTKQEATPITVVLRDFQRILREQGESSVLELTGLGKSLQVLIHDIDLDPVTSVPRHADFYAIEKGAKVEMEVPLTFIGESEAVKGGANLVTILREITVEADAAHLPHELEIDISVLANMGDQIHVSDIKLPTGVTMITEGDEVIALIQEVAVEEETTDAPVDMSAIEVEKKGKTDAADGESEDAE